MRPALPPDTTVTETTGQAAAHAPFRQQGLTLRESVVARALQDMTPAHLPTVWRSVPGNDLSGQSETTQSFFALAQARVGEPAQSALAATIIPSPAATASSFGTALLVQPGRTSRGGWSQPTASLSASIGKSQRVVPPQATPIGTGALGVGKATMELRVALESRRREALSPYHPQAWALELPAHGLQDRYPSLVDGLANGFDLGVPHIHSTFTPPNHQSTNSLVDVYNSIVDNEFAARRYIGPFTRIQLEACIGPFQTSPTSLVPKTSKPGKFRAVHDFSHPHSPTPNATSINSQIDSDEFPCTWGTFSTVALIIARLPPGSQASVRDVAEAYRTIPASPSQWPGLVIRLRGEDQFAVNTCNNFGLSSAGGVYGMVADAGADIFRGCGIGPLAKWVDDHIFFRVPRCYDIAHLTSFFVYLSHVYSY
jgi:hypothetical protein